MNPEEKEFSETMSAATRKLNAEKAKRELVLHQEQYARDSARRKAQEEAAARALAAEPDDVKEARRLLLRIRDADPHRLNQDMGEWRIELARLIRRHEALVALEEFRAEERARIAALPPTRTVDLRFVAVTDHAVVLHDECEMHLRSPMLGGLRWRFASMGFVRAEEAESLAALIAEEEARRRAMPFIETAKLATLLTPEQWRDPALAARAAGVDISDYQGRITCKEWLQLAINDERVAAVWLESALGRALDPALRFVAREDHPIGAAPFAEAIQDALAAAQTAKPGVSSLNDGRSFWLALSRTVLTESPAADVVEHVEAVA